MPCCALNLQVRPCFNATECAVGEECVASNQCFKTTCPAGASAYITTTCASVCAPAVREAISARIGEDAKSIIVTLNSAALPAGFLCSALFDANSSAILGANTWCTASGTSVIVALVPESTVRANDTLFIKAGQTVLKDMLVQNKTFAASNVTVSDCIACKDTQFPVVRVLAPQVGVEQQASVRTLRQNRVSHRADCRHGMLTPVCLLDQHGLPICESHLCTSALLA